MEWLKQLSRAIDYIEDNLADEISLDEAAKIACCSTYYFQRMFSYVTGIHLSEYIRRRRMTLAAFELQTSSQKVMDIGLKYGYESPTAFNRAFQSVHSAAPTTARLQGTALQAYPRLRFSISVTGEDAMHYRIESKAPIRIVGSRTAINSDIEQNFKIVPHFWRTTRSQSIYSQICNLNNQSPFGVLGVTVCQNPGEIYYYIAAATDKNVPVNLFIHEIPFATWVIFECSGVFPISIQNVFRHFLTEWLPFSGYTYAELPDIEVYPVDPQRQENNKAEVWIAVKKQIE
jgi:AraC family transcriptional regulator